MKDHTLNELLEILQPHIEAGTINCKYGKLDGDDFFIVDSNEDLAFIDGLLNGFVGLKLHYGPYNGETLADERLKKENELINELLVRFSIKNAQTKFIF